ncbi:MAG TPA: hypothetical protein VGJ05_09190, partial [Fimbriiglobus sp.]
RPPAANRNKDLMQFPLLKRIGDVLGGQLMRMEDGFHPTALASAVAPAEVAEDDLDPTPPTDPDEA